MWRSSAVRRCAARSWQRYRLGSWNQSQWSRWPRSFATAKPAPQNNYTSNHHDGGAAHSSNDSWLREHKWRLLALAGVGLVTFSDTDYLQRVSRTSYCAFRCGFEYWNTQRKFGKHKESNPEVYDKAMENCHEHCAYLLLRLAESNGGMFIKAGQHISSLSYAVPKAYTRTLSVLQDRAPSRPFSVARQVVEDELGGDLADSFTHFDHTPLGSASLAQVHRAICARTGKLVAVKVQYPELRSQVKDDLDVAEALMNVMGRFFPTFREQWWWLLTEVREAVLRELDFRTEAYNADLCRRMFEGHSSKRVDAAHSYATAEEFTREGLRPEPGKRIGGRKMRFPKDPPLLHVPDIEWDLTTRRILTMEFIDGWKVSQVDKLTGARLDPRAVGKDMLRMFFRQMFVFGFQHCDPHPGNILIRPRLPQDRPPLRDMPPEVQRMTDWDRVEQRLRLWLAAKQRSLMECAHTCQRTVSEWWDPEPWEVRSAAAAAQADAAKQAESQRPAVPEVEDPVPHQVVLLDHGMYRNLSDHFRYNFCGMFRAMISLDMPRYLKHCRELGIQRYAEVFPLIFMFRPMTSTAKAGKKLSPQERQEILKKMKNTDFDELMQFMKEIPRDFLFCMRVISLVRHLNVLLGGNTAERLMMMAECAIEGAYVPRSAVVPSMSIVAPCDESEVTDSWCSLLSSFPGLSGERKAEPAHSRTVPLALSPPYASPPKRRRIRDPLFALILDKNVQIPFLTPPFMREDMDIGPVLAAGVNGEAPTYFTGRIFTLAERQEEYYRTHSMWQRLCMFLRRKWTIVKVRLILFWFFLKMSLRRLLQQMVRACD